MITVVVTSRPSVAKNQVADADTEVPVPMCAGRRRGGVRLASWLVVGRTSTVGRLDYYRRLAAAAAAVPGPRPAGESPTDQHTHPTRQTAGGWMEHSGRGETKRTRIDAVLSYAIENLYSPTKVVANNHAGHAAHTHISRSNRMHRV